MQQVRVIKKNDKQANLEIFTDYKANAYSWEFWTITIPEM